MSTLSTECSKVIGPAGSTDVIRHTFTEPLVVSAVCVVPAIVVSSTTRCNTLVRTVSPGLNLYFSVYFGPLGGAGASLSASAVDETRAAMTAASPIAHRKAILREDIRLDSFRGRMFNSKADYRRSS